MTEEQTLMYADRVIQFIRSDEDMRDLEVGYWISILGTALFYMGVVKAQEKQEKTSG
jgi:hypothetical protein